MLAMASSALGFSQVAKNAKVVEQFAGGSYDGAWRWMWQMLAYQFDHVAWTGCAFWDLIQPSFMFMVGVAVPFSNARRQKDGQSLTRRFFHVLWRAAVLVALGVFLSSNGADLTNFTFVNVLTQIGLGYPLLYLLSEKTGRREDLGGWLKVQCGAALVILLGYWGWFAYTDMPEADVAQLKNAVQTQKKKLVDGDWNQFEGLASHWNKHTNAAAVADRTLLNLVPRTGDEVDGRKFWINDGGYQTLNFIPSLATMLFGLMAGTVLRSEAGDRKKLKWLFVAGGICFVASMAVDTTIWPSAISDALGAKWTLCPAVKRIWTPTWAVFSTGWTLWILAAFYLVIDIWQFRRWSWALAVVGVNSITMYMMSQLMRGFTRSSLKTHLATVDSWLGSCIHSLQDTSVGDWLASWFDPKQGIVYHLFSPEFAYSPITERLAVLFVFWLACVWLHSQKIYVRI